MTRLCMLFDFDLKGIPNQCGKKNYFSCIVLQLKLSFPHLFPHPGCLFSKCPLPSSAHKPKHTSNTSKSLHRILYDKSHVGSAFMSFISGSALYAKMYVSHSACVGSEWAAYILSRSHAACMATRGERQELLFEQDKKSCILVYGCASVTSAELCGFNCFWMFVLFTSDSKQVVATVFKLSHKWLFCQVKKNALILSWLISVCISAHPVPKSPR